MTKIDIIIMVIAMPFYLFLAPYCIKESYRNLKEARKIIKEANEKYN
ncbi:hypothetical protein AB9M75_12540 [Lactobacillus sp. AN1001]